jgi:hypothetical protein
MDYYVLNPDIYNDIKNLSDSVTTLYPLLQYWDKKSKEEARQFVKEMEKSEKAK